MTLIVKRPRTSQPQVAVGVDWSNPITRSLEWAKIAPSALFTGAFGGQPTLGGGATPDPQTLVAGISSKYDTTNYAVLPAGIGNAAEGTVLVVHASTALPPSGGGGYSHVLASNISPSSSNGWMLMLGNGNGYLTLRTVNPAAGYADGTVALNDGRVHASIGVWRTASGAQVRSYVDGRVNGTGTNAAAGSVSQDTWVGKAQDSFWSGLQGNILFVALFRRALSDSEALALSANPWQLLLQPSRRLWVAPAVVGGTSLTPGAAALVLAGYAPTVTRTANVSLVPAAAALALSGYAPTIAQPWAATPAPSVITLAGYAPAVSQTSGTAILPGAATLSLAGYIPTVVRGGNLSLVPGVAALALAGYTPFVSNGAPAPAPAPAAAKAPAAVKASSSGQLTPPRNGIPIASVTVNGVEYNADINAEWMRYLTFGVFNRVGGVSGPSTVEAAQEAGGNGGTEEARAMIVDLRSDVDQIVNHGRIASVESAVATMVDMGSFAMLETIAELREKLAALTERVNTFEQAPSL